MKIKLSDHFTYNRLLRFTLPSVVMMVVASIYSVVDGLFVSNLVGDLALSAVNIIFPVTMIIGAFGFMLGIGGSAIVARTLGEGRKELAQEYFSMLIYTVLVVGGILSVVSVVLTEPIARLVGASDLLMDDCVAYGRIMLVGGGGRRGAGCSGLSGFPDLPAQALPLRIKNSAFLWNALFLNPICYLSAQISRT